MAGLFAYGCGKPQAPATVAKQDVQRDPARTANDQQHPKSTPTPEAGIKPATPARDSVDRSIENADLESALTKIFVKESRTKTIQEACEGTDAASRESYLEIASSAYGDLDGDGREEAAVTAFSCNSGNAGPDLFSVFRLKRDGTLEELTFEPRKPSDRFRGKDLYAGLRGRMVVLIEKNRLILEYPVYRKDDASCCATGGTRHFIYRWNGEFLLLEDVVDLPESPN